MAVLDNNPVKDKKRKLPPTFQHLPRDRAQKLKKQWVEKKKLKSQWKSQKRKEGLDSGWGQRTAHLQSLADSAETPSAQEQEGHDESVSEQSHSDSEEANESGLSGPAGKKARKAASGEPRPLSAKAKGKQPSRSTADEAGDEEGKKDEKPSLRELTRQAYSRESLHTFRADPLHRRKDTISHLRGGQRGDRGRGRGGAGARGSSRGGRGTGTHSRGNSNTFGRGDRRGGGREARGQPNMKLRMDAMLEQIKQNYS